MTLNVTFIRSCLTLATVVALILPLSAQAEDGILTQAQMDQIMAPIALYPDPLLGEVLMAATHPVDIVEAARWLSDPATTALQASAFSEALQTKNWDPSVKALTVFPPLLHEMNNEIEWTHQLGTSFEKQQADMTMSIQRLRAAAQQAGNLQSDAHENVTLQDGNISIVPTDATQMSLPTYDASTVYGTWPYPEEQPYSFVTPSAFDMPAPPMIVSLGLVQPYWGGIITDWRAHHIQWDDEHRRANFGVIVEGPITPQDPQARQQWEQQHQQEIKERQNTVPHSANAGEPVLTKTAPLVGQLTRPQVDLNVIEHPDDHMRASEGMRDSGQQNQVPLTGENITQTPPLVKN